MLVSGICVRTEFRIYRGRDTYVAIHKRDSSTTFKSSMTSPGGPEGHRMALEKWMKEWTGIGPLGLTADFEVTATGHDYEGQYWILHPVRYN